MKIWTNNQFAGYWPVGTAAVVVADDADSAADYLNVFLREKGLPESTPDEFEEFSLDDGEVRILCDGDYGRRDVRRQHD